jgi:hypothetical protein
MKAEEEKAAMEAAAAEAAEAAAEDADEALLAEATKLSLEEAAAQRQREGFAFEQEQEATNKVGRILGGPMVPGEPQLDRAWSPRLKLKYNMMNRFQTLLSMSTCAARTRRLRRPPSPSKKPTPRGKLWWLR